MLLLYPGRRVRVLCPTRLGPYDLPEPAERDLGTIIRKVPPQDNHDDWYFVALDDGRRVTVREHLLSAIPEEEQAELLGEE